MISVPQFYLTTFLLAFVVSLFWFGDERERIGFPWLPLAIAAFWIASASLFIHYTEKEDIGLVELIWRSVDPAYFYSGNEWVALRGPGALAMFSIAVFSTLLAWAWSAKNRFQARRKEERIKSLQKPSENRRI